MVSTRALARLALLPALFAAFTSVGAQATAGRITGLITDRTVGAPIANVTVTVAGTQLGARTGADGRYSINDVPPGAQRVRASRIGYAPFEQSVTVSAGQTATLNVALSAASVTLDQMVVTGYGAQRRSDLTGSVATVTPNT